MNRRRITIICLNSGAPGIEAFAELIVQARKESCSVVKHPSDPRGVHLTQYGPSG